MANETAQIFPEWLKLVTDNQVKGKRTHDARIAAVMMASHINHLLTLNPRDFSGIPDITIVHPQAIVDEATATE